MDSELTGDLCLGHPAECESFAGVELPQVGAAPVRGGRRARCSPQEAEERRQSHLLLLPLLLSLLPLLHAGRWEESPEEARRSLPLFGPATSYFSILKFRSAEAT